MSAGIVLDMPERDYHAHPALSSTQARLLLDSPAKYKWSLAHPQPHKDAFDLGTAVHSKVLGVGAEAVVLDFPDFRTKAAREARDEARAAGLIVVTATDFEQITGMAEAVLAHPVARSLFEQEGNAESSVFATDPTTGVGMRARFDFLPNLDLPNPIAVDLKTTAKSASKEGFARSVLAFNYDVQETHYDDTLRFATGAEVPFVFAVVETEAPHLVAIHQLDTQWREMGHQKARRAREVLAECTESGVFPGYPESVNLLSPPVYALYQHEEKYA